MQRGSCQITTVILAGLAAFALPALSEESNQDLQGEKRVADEGAGGQEADSNRSIAALETTELEEVKVTGDWLGAPTEDSVKTYPGARTAITERELHQAGMRNVEDALRLVPGVRVQDESGTGILPNIGVRGLDPRRSQRTLVLVDGIPIALAPYGQTGLSMFPLTMQTVESIDVARGGVAVRYGPNNVGGVINFVSKPIPETFSTTLKEALTISSETGNVLTDSYFRVGGFVNDRLGLQFQANTVLGDSFRSHSDTEVENLIADANWFLTDNASIKARLQYYNTDTELPGGLSPEAYRDDRFQSQRPFDKFQGHTVRGHLIYNQNFDFFGAPAEFNWSNFAHTSDREFTVGCLLNSTATSCSLDPSRVSNGVQTSPRTFTAYGTEPRLTVGATTGWLDHKFTLGGRYVSEEVDQAVDRRRLSTGRVNRAQDFQFTTDAVALYASDTLSVWNQRLSATPGLRVEWIDQTSHNRLNGTEAGSRNDELLPGLDVGFHLWPDKVFLFGNLHKSLQPVQFTQITLEGDTGVEEAWNYEAGMRLTPLPELSAAFTFFQFDFENQIVAVVENGTTKFRNLGKTRHQGYETELGWTPSLLPGLDLKAGYTYVDTEQLNNVFSGATQVAFKGNRVPFSSTHQFTLQGNYRIGTYNFNVNGLYLSSAFTDAANTEREDATGSRGEIPSYWVWNAQVTKDFRIDGTNLRAGLAANNLFNENYYFRGVDTSLGRVPGPGRSVMLSLQLDL
ncbi:MULTISPECIES: TonB-dependent siderophore receptor [unclassified Methylocaldum]|uniref:TonB-dependent receptor family protein n=1 Tax=unclassified Methylocaldum TaxID=2622260 RepID=UPI001AE6D04E|nr:TonB-dependent siderophore receptor [Methylocaldum sp. RMAD-M]MBP1149651.1 Fe(3+) dicitrate transport protein [Methylocaldum sp. RMAD-M]